MNGPLFTVIVPAYNRLSFLVDTLDSVWRQTLESFEVIVVDDGSSDGTAEYLRALQGKARLLTQPNLGPGAARNRGLEEARGAYAAFIDSDDVWFPWTLATYATLIRELDSPAFIAGKPFRFEAVESLRHVSAEPVTRQLFADYLKSGDLWRWWGVSSFVIRTDVVRAAGGFAVGRMNGEDADLALKLGTAQRFVQIVSPFTFGYREHPASVMKDLEKTLAGVRHLIHGEKTGRYPGGAARASERLRILTRHVRPVSLDCLREGRAGDAWELYAATLSWHLRLGRWKYLLGFPLQAALKWPRIRTGVAHGGSA